MLFGGGKLENLAVFLSESAVSPRADESSPVQCLHMFSQQIIKGLLGIWFTGDVQGTMDPSREAEAFFERPA
eukprot:6190155-Pleurochrysis_carterae.AAC.1